MKRLPHYRRAALQVGLKHLMLGILYVAICCLVYVQTNLWYGTLVIAATILVISQVTFRAFKRQDYFALGFSVFAWAWLVFWLGFYAETGPNSSQWEMPNKVFYVMRFFREFPQPDSKSKITTYGYMHSLHSSGGMGTWDGAEPVAPSFHNAIRLAVCVTALLFGMLGGMVFSVLSKLDFGGSSVTDNDSTVYT